MDTLNITAHPAVITANYDAVKASLASEIEQYDIVVTADTVKDAKKLAADLNKVKAEIAARRKEIVDVSVGPIKEFETRVKELEAMCTEGRKKIVDQVKVFEDEQIVVVEKLILDYLEECYTSSAVHDEFRTATVGDLFKLSAITATGNLTKATKDAVESRVGRCLMAMTKTALRLSELATQSLQAGLHSPLVREHVEGILFGDDDDAYQASLDALIKRELTRQEETLAAARLKDAIEAPKEDGLSPEQVSNMAAEGFGIENLTDDSITAFEPPEPATQPEEPPLDNPPTMKGMGTINKALDQAPPAVAQDGKVTFRMSIHLEVHAPQGATAERVEAALRKKLAAAGVEKSVTGITTTQV